MFIKNDVNKLYESFTEKVYEADVLSKKTKELIAFSCSIMADCIPCINYHYKKAVSEGANKNEIAEACAITISISAGSKKAKYSSVIAEL